MKTKDFKKGSLSRIFRQLIQELKSTLYFPQMPPRNYAVVRRKDDCSAPEYRRQHYRHF
ncbi:hypothetical protein [Flavilitoribacter nigricans]|uniref:hypothetical protein n=1 Tax=Flavilitoribacter nigricans TaxID=70997 RepID=UPI0014758957|nr:hypothetical protein [Flavilitoribacter nigricans]